MTTTRNAELSPTKPGHAGIGNATRSELTKFRSIRSTWICLVIIFVAGLGLSALISFAQAKHWTQACLSDRATFDPTQVSQTGFFISQFVVGVLGALVITSEYASGSIKTTIASLPRRTTVVGAKTVVLAVCVFVVAEVTGFLSFFIGQAVLTSMGGKVYSLTARELYAKFPNLGQINSCHDFYIPMSKLPIPVATLSNSSTLRAVFLGGLYLTLMALLALGLGLMLRHTAGTISLFVGLLLVVPLILHLLPTNIVNAVEKYLPSNLGGAMTTVVSRQTDFAGVLMTPWVATLTLTIYVVVVLAFGGWLLVKRDA